MNRRGNVLQVKPGTGYYSTTLPIVCGNGGWGSSVSTSVHRIVAYTFLGPPPQEGMTVDHMNRIPEDNRAANLRWATTWEQLKNRSVQSRAFQLPDGTVVTTMRDLARRLQHPWRVLSNRLRTLQRPGDVVIIGETPVVLVRQETRIVQLRQEYRPMNRGAQGESRVHCAWRLWFVERHTVDEMAAHLAIQSSTVVSYLDRAIRQASPDEVKEVCCRWGLDTRQKKDDMMAELESILSTAKEKGVVDKAELARQYECVVFRHCRVGDANEARLVASLRRIL